MSLQKIGKVFAVFSALVLGGCYVGYRSLEQATVEPDVKKHPYNPTVLPSSKNPTRMTVLPSSKSIDAILKSPSRKFAENDFIRPIPGIPAGTEVIENIQRPLLPGSKIGTILKPEDAEIIDQDKIEAIDKGWKRDLEEDTPPP